MIMYADCISHGSTLAEYDSRHDTATLIRTWGMPSEICSTSMYERMMNHIAATSHIRPPNHKKLKATIIRIEASPTPEETKGWTEKDWELLANCILSAMDEAEPKKKHKNFRHTHLSNTMGAVYLHRDSNSGIHHLHFFMCRADNDGHVNCGNHIGELAVAAANIINTERGWLLPEEIHEAHVREITDLCYNILRNMNAFSIDDYLDHIRNKGFVVKIRESEGRIVGYTVMYGNSPLNASKLADKHSLTAANLEKTWAKLHNMTPKEISILGSNGERVRSRTIWEPAQKEKPKILVPVACPVKYVDETPSKKNAGYTKRTIAVNNTDYDVEVSNSVFDILKTDIEEPLEDAAVNTKSMLDMTILLFAGYVDAATKVVPSSGGGGGNNDLPKRKKDEDDEQWAHRCAAFIRNRSKKPTYRIKR